MGKFRGLHNSRLRYLAVIIAPVIALVTIMTVYATDNTGLVHWHSESPNYTLLTDQLPDAWENPIRQAADEWTQDTNISIVEANNSPNTIWRGSIPIEWWGDCPPSVTAACTWTSWSNYHITRSQTVFNWDFGFGTASWKCWLDIGRDVKTYALHEFGHFAGYLGHSTDSDSAMYVDLTNCQRTLDDHDVDSMNHQYSSH